jgi:phosphoglycolate phosphatase-like HAD superfamily hydrolase
MATIPNTPDLAAALQAATTDAVKRLGQLHALGATEEAGAATLRSERDQALTDCETYRRLYESAQEDLRAERAKTALLESKMSAYDGLPEVIAKRRAALTAQRDNVQAELDKLGKQ